MVSVLVSAFVGHLATKLISELGRQHGQQVSPTYSSWLMPGVHQRNRSGGILRCDHISYSHLAHLEMILKCFTILFFPRNVFLGSGLLTAQRHWKTRWNSIPLCPLTAAHSQLVSRRTQKADPVFTLEWGLPCQHYGYHPETGSMWKTSCWHINAQQGGSFQRAAFHTTRVSYVLRDCRPRCPASFWIHFKRLFSFFRNFN